MASMDEWRKQLKKKYISSYLRFFWKVGHDQAAINYQQNICVPLAEVMIYVRMQSSPVSNQYIILIRAGNQQWLVCA